MVADPASGGSVHLFVFWCCIAIRQRCFSGTIKQKDGRNRSVSTTAFSGDDQAYFEAQFDDSPPVDF